jgi:2-polyprenyl-3-methyl-5-hydroxy-6-metoxy-1,4-benzoquinol methylase
LIVGGEVLEHIDRPGEFMASCSQMLLQGGRLVISVPNPWFINVLLKNIRRRTTFVDSADHVAWYEASVLYELGQRHGLELDRATGIGSMGSKTVKARLLSTLRPLLLCLGFSPELFAKSIIYEFVRL